MSRTSAALTATSLQAAASAACRANFYIFAKQAFAELHPGVQLDEAPYIEALAFAIQEVADGRNRRLNINVPPRHLKSFLVSVALPAWLMGRDPSFKTLFAAYGQDGTVKANAPIVRIGSLARPACLALANPPAPSAISTQHPR